MALYMGPSSNFGYQGDSGYQGGNPPRAIWGQPMNGAGQSKTVSTGAAGAPAAGPPNTLAAQAIRASGPSQGYDPNYLQNMASSIGSLFSSPGGGTTNVNPLGNLSDISPPSQMEGNAPSQGLPLTWLQQALNGGGFSFAPPAAVTPTAPTIGSTGSSSGGGGVRGGNNGGIQAAMIRAATSSDISRIVELGSRWLAESPYQSIIKDIPGQTAKFAAQVIKNGKVLLHENDNGKVSGLLAFLIFEHPFTGETTATELMWYMEPEDRTGGGGLKLLWEAEKEAKQMGATMMGFTAPTTEVAALYQRFGYRQVEVTYMKGL